jgi:ribosomal protein S19
MSKSKWKPKFMHKSIAKLAYKKGKKLVWSRASVIPSYLIGTMVLVHSGNAFKNMYITAEKVGYKFGEFVFTRKRYVPKAQKNQLKKGIKKK